MSVDCGIYKQNNDILVKLLGTKNIIFLMFCPFLREFCESDHKEMLKSVLRMHLQSKNEINYGTIGYST